MAAKYNLSKYHKLTAIYHLTAALIVFAILMSPSHAAETTDALTKVGITNGSWIAFAIISASVLISWLINYTAPKIRAFGTLLASTGCFALVAWFVFVTGTGFLENPRPSEIPMDSAKPALLWLQTGAALLAGCGLLLVAFAQSKSSKTLELPSTNQPAHYGRVLRLLHWSIAILILIMIPMGIFTTTIPEDTWYRSGYYAAHQTIGIVIFALVLLRLVWNRISTRPALDSSLRPWERKLAHAAHLGLYMMMIALPLSGYIMTSYFGHPTALFSFHIQPFWGENESFAMIFGMTHKYILPYLLYIILGSHILGALKHKFIDKHENALSRMVS